MMLSVLANRTYRHLFAAQVTTRCWPRAGRLLPCNFVFISVPSSMKRTEHCLTQRINSVPQVMIPDSNRRRHALPMELNLDQSVPFRTVAVCKN